MKIETDCKKICGVDKTMKIIGQKWTVYILRDLMTGTKRFGQLQKSLEKISPRTLSLRLQQLEEDKILTKKIYPVIPPKVEYTLTSKGRSLNQIIENMREWGDCH